MGGKIIPRIRLTSAKDLVEVEAELGNLSNLVVWGIIGGAKARSFRCPRAF